jgi:hypothetical protein
MKNKLTAAAVALVVLAAGGIALAKGPRATSVTAVSGTFTATTLHGKSETTSCTTTDGKTLVSTHAVFSGSATGAADLTGTLTADAHSVIDTTDGLGTVDAKLHIATSAGKTELHLAGVYDHGNVVGLATGHGATKATQILANLSAGFSTGGGFTDGKIGSGASGGAAVELGPGHCAPAPKNAPAAPKHKH